VLARPRSRGATLAQLRTRAVGIGRRRRSRPMLACTQPCSARVAQRSRTLGGAVGCGVGCVGAMPGPVSVGLMHADSEPDLRRPR
jgi:hypothetical protein